MNDLAVGYGRRSSEDEDKQINSIPDQVIVVKLLEEKHGIPIISDGILTEKKSAKIAGQREEFNRLIRLIEGGKINTIYTAVVNRLARNAKEAGMLIDYLDTGKLKQIISPNSTYDANTNSEMLWIEFMSSTKSSKDLSKVVKERLQRKAERGDYPGQAQIGYLNTPRRLKGQRSILVDKRKWDLMRSFLEFVLKGFAVEEALGIVTKKGLRGKNGKPISRSAAYALLRNIFYTGYFYYAGNLYKGNHKPMLSMIEWQKIQEILNKKGKKGAYTLEFTKEKEFQGMLKCGECGGTITMGKHIRYYKNGSTQIFWHYHCTKKLGPCSQPTLNAKFFEPQVKEYLKRLELDPIFSDWIKKVLKRRNHQEFEFSRRNRRILTSKLETVDDRKEALGLLKIKGNITEKKYRTRMQALLKEETELNEAISTKTTDYWESVLDNVIDFGSNVTKLFDRGDIYTRQMVLRILGLNLIMKDKKVYIEPKNAFIFLKDLQETVFENRTLLEPKTDGVVDQNRNSTKSVLSCAGERT